MRWVGFAALVLALGDPADAEAWGLAFAITALAAFVLPPEPLVTITRTTNNNINNNVGAQTATPEQLREALQPAREDP